MRHIGMKVDPIVGQNELVLETEQEQIGPLALELTLLVNDLSERLLLLAPSGYRIALSIQKNEERGQFAARTKVTQPDPRRMAFELSRTQAGYMQATLLRTYRDGMAAADHIHIEGFAGEHLTHPLKL